MSEKVKTIILSFVCLALIVIPVVKNQSGYLVGGDDTKLYYVFPDKFLSNYAFNLISDNTLAGANSGYYPVSYFAPLFIVFWLLKVIPLNTQFLSFGINLAVGFLFTYKLLILLRPQKSVASFTGYVLSALLFVFSPFLTETLYNHQLLSMYLVATFPLTTFLFLKGVKEHRFSYTLFASIVFSLFSTTLNALPWIAGFLLASLPAILFLLIEKKHAIKHFIVFTTSSVLLNFYWIFFFIHSQIYGSGLSTTTETYSSNSFVFDNLRIIETVSRMFSPLSQIFHNVLPNGYATFQTIDVLSCTILVMVMLALATAHKEHRKALLISGLCLLFSWFLFSPNMGSWGPKTFVFLSRNIPFFTMFRNMFDKFSLPLAFYYALCFGFSIHALQGVLKKHGSVIVLGISFTVVMFFGKSLFELKDTQENRFSGRFNSDYMNLVTYFEGQTDQSRILWLPLNGPTYANIEDDTNTGSYYSGLSPLHILSGKPDYTGRFSFIIPEDIFYGDKIFNSLRAGNYQEVGEALQKLNARYIVIDKQRLPANIADFMYGGEGYPLLTAQSEEFYEHILGEKLTDFGQRYSVYKIAEKYDSDRVYVASDTARSLDSNAKSLVRYEKLSSDRYSITFSRSDIYNNLVFLDPYYRDWEVIHNDNEVFLDQSVAFGYANAWNTLPLIENSNTEDVTVQLVFRPQQYSLFAYSVSIITVLLLLSYIAYDYSKHRIL